MKTIKYGSYYFVTGKGFIARTEAEATKFQDQAAALRQQECLRSAGVNPGVITDVATDPNIVQNSDGSSWAVYYVRPNQVRSDGSVIAHRNNPSTRRFATADEAKHHGARFAESEGHVGFWIQKRYGERVNAYVNKVTGKTNPDISR